VLGNVETLSWKEFYQMWASVTDTKIQVMRVSTADYCEMFPNYRMEMYLMFYFWEKFGEAAWSGVDVLIAGELGISQELVSVRSSLQEVDWSSVIGTQGR
jgi:hypothetical protein